MPVRAGGGRGEVARQHAFIAKRLRIETCRRMVESARETDHMSGVKVVGETGRKILVLDSEQIILDLLQRVLSHEGHRVSTARCADEAMKEVCNGMFDLVIADVDVCASNGRELMRVIGEQSPQSAVIVMTAYAGEGIARFAQEQAQGLLEKPFALERLLAVVRAALEARGENARQMGVVSSVGSYLQAGVQA